MVKFIVTPVWLGRILPFPKNPVTLEVSWEVAEVTSTARRSHFQISQRLKSWLANCKNKKNDVGVVCHHLGIQWIPITDPLGGWYVYLPILIDHKKSTIHVGRDTSHMDFVGYKSSFQIYVSPKSWSNLGLDRHLSRMQSTLVTNKGYDPLINEHSNCWLEYPPFF